MILLLIYFLPSIVSLLWFFSFLLKRKDYRQRMFFLAEGTSAVFYAILGIYFYPEVDYDTIVRMECVCLPFGLLFPCFVVAYMHHLKYGRRMPQTRLSMLFVPSIVLAVGINLLCYLIGYDNAAEVSRQYASGTGLTGAMDTDINRLYHYFTYHAFVALIACYIVYLMGLSVSLLYRHGYHWGDVSRFFLRGKATTPARTIATMYILELMLMVPVAALGSAFYTKQPVLGVTIMIALAAVKHIIAYLEFFGNHVKLVTLYELSHLSVSTPGLQQVESADTPTVQALQPDEATPQEDSHQAPQAPMKPQENDTPEPPQEPVAAPKETAHTVGQQKMNRRYEEFRILMEEKKVWQDENLSAQSICDMMNIGKTTLSALIGQYYDTSFRELVNRYRIEEAMRYMRAHPMDTQETVAMHCGFRNAQYFNTQFHKLVGTTPAVWMATKA